MKKRIALLSIFILLGAGCFGNDGAQKEAAGTATQEYCFEIFGSFDERYDECYEKNYPVFLERKVEATK